MVLAVDVARVVLLGSEVGCVALVVEHLSLEEICVYDFPVEVGKCLDG